MVRFQIKSAEFSECWKSENKPAVHFTRITIGKTAVSPFSPKIFASSLKGNLLGLKLVKLTEVCKMILRSFPTI